MRTYDKLIATIPERRDIARMPVPRPRAPRTPLTAW